MLSDAHMHLDRCQPEQLREFIEEANRRGVAVMVAASMDLESSAETVAIGDLYNTVYPAVGIHPWNTTIIDQEIYSKLWELATHKGVVTISEIGLDFARDAATYEVQKQAFSEQVRLAKELGLPVIVHCREAHSEMMDILKQYTASETG